MISDEVKNYTTLRDIIQVTYSQLLRWNPYSDQNLTFRSWHLRSDTQLTPDMRASRRIGVSQSASGRIDSR
ncbi:hypothetical protein [Nonomuraea cavernae]|uniref:hypothetical protein n=1 Tax=Nonomuraea cavernae TaxID=2045107 RepID=UPI0034081B46